MYTYLLYSQVDITVSLCLSLGGGVLLATCFIHMIPEVRHAIESHSGPAAHQFPFTELLVCIGFFIVYIVEESVRHCLQTRQCTKSGERELLLFSSIELHYSSLCTSCRVCATVYTLQTGRASVPSPESVSE